LAGVEDPDEDVVPLDAVVDPEPEVLLPDPLEEPVVAVVGTWLAGVSTQVDVPALVIVWPGL
jgi:hypothetical protein